MDGTVEGSGSLSLTPLNEHISLKELSIFVPHLGCRTNISQAVFDMGQHIHSFFHGIGHIQTIILVVSIIV